MGVISESDKIPFIHKDLRLMVPFIENVSRVRALKQYVSIEQRKLFILIRGLGVTTALPFSCGTATVGQMGFKCVRVLFALLSILLTMHVSTGIHKKGCSIVIHFQGCGLCQVHFTSVSLSDNYPLNKSDYTSHSSNERMKEWREFGIVLCFIVQFVLFLHFGVDCMLFWFVYCRILPLHNEIRRTLRLNRRAARNVFHHLVVAVELLTYDQFVIVGREFVSMLAFRFMFGQSPMFCWD